MNYSQENIKIKDYDMTKIGKVTCIYSTLFFLILCNLVFGQKSKGAGLNHHALNSSNIDISKLESFFKQNKEFSLPNRTSFLDTIIFEHKNKYFFSFSPPMDILGDGRYILAEKGKEPEVYLYDQDGLLIRKISRFGQGPGEVTGAIGISHDENYIYISDGDQKKIIILSHKGKFIREVRKVRNWASNSFAVSPISNRYFYYHLFPSPMSLLFSMGNLESGMLKHFGEVDEINKIAMHVGGISSIVFNEQGLLFVIKPAEYGFEVYNDQGVFLRKVSNERSRFFKPPTNKEIKKIEKDHLYSLELFYNHTRTQNIFYLGGDLLVILYYKNYLVNGEKITFKYLMSKKDEEIPDMKFVSHFEIWKTNGEFIGRSEIVGKHPGIHFANNGYLYFWEQNDVLDKNGFFPNPNLIRYDLWQELGWRK